MNYFSWWQNGSNYTGTVVDPHGTWWVENGGPHRLGGPAFEGFNGKKVWYHKGLIHRLEGPAVIHTQACVYYYLDGVQCTQEKWSKDIRVQAATLDPEECIKHL